jgi:hypothetical protein
MVFVGARFRTPTQPSTQNWQEGDARAQTTKTYLVGLEGGGCFGCHFPPAAKSQPIAKKASYEYLLSEDEMTRRD